MANPTPIEETIALHEFLHRFLEDREGGGIQSIEAYERLFPNASSVLRDEYARLVGPASERVAPPERTVGTQSGPSFAELDCEAPFADSQDQSQGQRLGPFRLVRRLGQGAFGLVYLAEDTRLARKVALKLLARAELASGRERAMFQREAEIASRLEHPGICAIHEIGEHGIWTYIAMRYVPGESLAERIAQERLLRTQPPTVGGLGQPDATRGAASMPANHAGRVARMSAIVACIEKIADALHQAHEAGVIHRDIKPANIMLAPGDQPVILDFGLARETGPDGLSLTASNEVLGTPIYMSPEQIRGDRKALDRRTDVWSLGATLYEWLTLQRPFEAHSEADVFRAILEREPVSARRFDRAVPKDLAVVLATALAKEPSRRYQSAAAFAEDLRAVRCHEPIRARPVGLIGQLVRWARRSPLAAGLTATILVTVLAGLTVAGLLLLRAERHLLDWERLADGRRLEDLVRIDEEELWPAVPEHVPAMAAWLSKAHALVARLGDHRRALDALRASARPYGDTAERRDRDKHSRELQELAAIADATVRYRAFLDADEEARQRMQIRASTAQIEAMLAQMEQRRVHFTQLVARRLTWEFDDAGDQLRHDRLAELVTRLAQMSGETPVEGATTLAFMEQRLAFARTLFRRTVEDHAGAWQAAIHRVATNPRYLGLRIVEQVGLVPRGPDPDSTLEEFGEIASGTLPARDATGDLALGENCGMVFVLLPGGSFVMGAQRGDPAAPGYDPAATPNEFPPREVDLAPFLIAKFEMTQGQWLRLAGENPSLFEPGKRDGEYTADLRHPVESVSWNDCVRILRRGGVQLPSEAQWEFACRGGTDTPWWCAADELPAAANLADRSARRVSNPTPHEDWDDGRGSTAPVGSYRPNGFGLHDVIGNVFEWCADSFGTYERSPRTGDGLRVFPGFEQVARGGSFLVPAAGARSAARFRADPTLRHNGNGARAVRVLVAP